jgi:hypothetical protein
MFMAIRTHESESIADPNGVNDTNAAAATNDDKYRRGACSRDGL